MPSISSRHLRIGGLVVAIVLFGLAAYPGTLAEPYETARGDPSYDHVVVPETSYIYEEYADDPDVETYRYDELSPTGQAVFDRTLDDPDREFEPTVCKDFLLVCDAYPESELPPEFTYGTQLRPDVALHFVEKDGERYLFQTGTINHAGLFGFSNTLFLAWPTVIPLGLFVARVAVKSGDDRYVAGVTGFGAVVAALALVAPYLELFEVVAAFWIGVAVLAGTWLLLLGAGVHRLYRLVAGRVSSATVEGS